MSLEGTPEFNRGFNYATYIEYVGDLTETPLDGQEYQPAPCVIPDTRMGYDLDGNYHAVLNGAALDPRIPEYNADERRRITTLSHHLIQSIIQELPEPYGTVGRADTVWEILADLEDDNGLYPMEFNSLFDLFVRNYNGGTHG